MSVWNKCEKCGYKYNAVLVRATEDMGGGRLILFIIADIERALRGEG